MSLETHLIIRSISLLVFAGAFFLVTAMIELDRLKSTNALKKAVRNISASSGLFLLSTASLTIAAIYSATKNYQDILVILLWIGHVTFAAWVISAVWLVKILRGMNGER